MSREEKWVDELNAENARLKPLFDKMTETSSDWRGQFTAVIPEDKFSDYNDAAVFYTASPLVKLYTDKNGMVACKCDGYRNGPAGG